MASSSSRKLPGGPPLIVPRTKGVGATGSSGAASTAAGAAKVSVEYREAIKVLSDATIREACRLLLSERDYQPPKTEHDNDKDKSMSDHEQLLALYVKVKKASEVVLREAPDEESVPSNSTSGNAAALMKGAPSIPSIPAARAAAASAAALSSSSSASMLKPAAGGKMFGKTMMTMPAPQRIGGVGRMFPPPPPASSMSAGTGMPPGPALKRAPLHRETSDGSGGSGSGSGGRHATPSSGPSHPPPYARMMAGPKLAATAGTGGGVKKSKVLGAVGPAAPGARSSPPETTSAAASHSMAAPPPPPPSALDFLAKLNRETQSPSESSSKEDRAASSSKSKGSTSTSSSLGKRGAAAAPSTASMSPPKKPKSAAVAQSDSGDEEEEDESSDEEEPDEDEAKDVSTSSRLRKRTTTTTTTPPSPDGTQRTPPTRTQPSRASRRNA